MQFCAVQRADGRCKSVCGAAEVASELQSRRDEVGFGGFSRYREAECGEVPRRQVAPRISTIRPGQTAQGVFLRQKERNYDNYNQL